MTIYIYTEHWTSRLTYVLDFIFVHIGKIKYFPWSEDVALSDKDLVVVYGKKSTFKHSNMIHIPSYGILNESGIRQIEIKVCKGQNMIPYFFDCSISDEEDYPFDLLGMVFFLLSRYEEYLSPAYDVYGRFCAKKSIAYQHQFLEIPLVDIWVNDLLNKIYSLGNTPVINSGFKIAPTIDVDQVWAFRYKGLKTWGGFFKDLLLFRPSLVLKRFAVLFLKAKDPFQTFEYIESLLKKYNKSARFFILFSKNPSRLDINHRRKNKAFTGFLLALAKNNSLGIHPSLGSGAHDAILKEEAVALSLLLKKEISASRFHYISFQIPKSYRALLNAGIFRDYSMGYPELIGFRASTGNCFFWYDLIEDQITPLKVFPFQIMDVTLKKYMGLRAEDAILLLRQLLNRWKQQTGCIRFIWHNSSFAQEYGWKDWDKVFELLLAADDLQHEDFNG